MVFPARDPNGIGLSPDGTRLSLTTNICFGGDDLTAAYITVSSTGRLLRTTWPRPGAKLHHLNT